MAARVGKEGAKKVKFGGATAWPRVEPRPEALPWFDAVFDLVLSHTRPIFQVIGVLYLVHPYWLQLADYVINDLGYSHRFFHAASIVGTHHIVWAIMNGFFLAADEFKLIERFRLPTNPASQPSWELKKQALWESLVGFFPMFFGAYVFWPVYKVFGLLSPFAPLPSFFEMWKLLALVKFFSTLTFDLTHRWLHSPGPYKAIHGAIHHKFIATESMSAEFANPIEGAGPILVPLLLAVPSPMFVIFLMWEQFNSAICHSGFCFNITPEGKLWKLFGFGFLADEAAYHQHHHYRNRGNFSSSWLDHLFGTQDDWLALGKRTGYIEFLHKEESNRLARQAQRKQKQT